MRPLPLFGPPLLDWYARNARVLPWRSQPTPYHVWLSEIMLQQTRVEAVRESYLRFLAAFPDLPALAAADTEQVLKLWEGMGYYSRARNLHKTARLVAETGFPADFDALLRLPGIGRYTAGAIASIAFGLPTPAVDGNVLRVLARLCADRRSIDLPALRLEAEERVRSQLPAQRPGDLNQAMMDLGATVCVPGKPHCLCCPLAKLCRGREQGIEAELPLRTPKKPKRREIHTVLLLTCKDRVAVQKRPEPGLLAGLWEYPHAEGSLNQAEAGDWLRARGMTATLLRPLPPAEHVFTHLVWELSGWQLEVEEPGEGFAWVEYRHLTADYAIPSAYRAYTRALDQWMIR